MRKKPSKFLVFILLLLSFAAWFVWVQVRPWEESEIATTSWEPNGVPLLAEITVSDKQGRPVKGVAVHLHNNSGGNSETTNEDGAVAIKLGEKDMGKLSVNGVVVVDRPLAYLINIPHVSNGLAIKVTLKDLKAFGVGQ